MIDDDEEEEDNKMTNKIKPSTSSSFNLNKTITKNHQEEEEEDDTLEPPPPPELEQETILDECHNQTLAKLRFVLELIETICSVAENKSNPIAIAMESSKHRSVRNFLSRGLGYFSTPRFWVCTLSSRNPSPDISLESQTRF